MSAPLILAIQPDRRQQPQLASIARQVSAELLLTESVERAMAVLADRLPDLILTPALLSHRDETALTERLREFGDVAAHIHTLTIPIFETTVSPSRKGGVLSSLRKQKRNGKAQKAETAGCTVDTFAEQISIYLKGAVETRGARRPVQTPSPATASEAEPHAEETTPDEPVVHHAESDGLPTIEELLARTPPVPEPGTSGEMRMEAIDVTPSVSALPVAAPSVETGVHAIVAIDTGLSPLEADCQMPMPVVVPRVAELAVDLPPAQLMPGGGIVAAMPLPAPVETGMEAVATMVPLVSAPGVPATLLTPVVAPQVAELLVHLPPVETTAHASGSTLALPAPPAGAVEMSMAAFAAMVPAVKAANGRPLPIPAAMSPLVEFRMELPAPAAPARVAVPTAPEYGSAVNVEAIAAMASVASAAATDRLAPLPADTPFTAALSLKLPLTDAAMTAYAVAPAAPESSRSAEMNLQVVAHIAPVITDQGLVPMPAAAMCVSELRMELPPSNVHPGVLAVPELPATPANASVDGFAAMISMASPASHHRPVPVPVTLPYVVELPMSRPSTPAGSADPRILVVPEPPAPRMEMGIETATATADAGRIPADAGARSVSAAVSLAVHKRTKKKAAQQERKAARKHGKKLAAQPPADDSSLFDPDEVRFSVLIAKLDQVAVRGDEAALPDGDGSRQVRARKPTSSTKHR